MGGEYSSSPEDSEYFSSDDRIIEEDPPAKRPLQLNDADFVFSDADAPLKNYDDSLEDHNDSLEDHNDSMEDHNDSMEDHNDSLRDRNDSLRDHNDSLEDHDDPAEDHDSLQGYSYPTKGRVNSSQDFVESTKRPEEISTGSTGFSSDIPVHHLAVHAESSNSFIESSESLVDSRAGPDSKSRDEMVEEDSLTADSKKVDEMFAFINDDRVSDFSSVEDLSLGNVETKLGSTDVGHVIDDEPPKPSLEPSQVKGHKNQDAHIDEHHGSLVSSQGGKLNGFHGPESFSMQQEVSCHLQNVSSLFFPHTF